MVSRRLRPAATQDDSKPVKIVSMKVTAEMKKAGADVLLRGLGAQFIPDWWWVGEEEEELVESILSAMLAVAPLEFLSQHDREKPSCG